MPDIRPPFHLQRPACETIAASVVSKRAETGGDNLSFEKSAFSWDIKATPPKAGQRLSYEVGTNSDNKPCALNLETI